MASEELGEKTEAPTPRRRSEARAQGNIAKSQDMTAAVMLLGAMILLWLFGTHMIATFKTLLQMMLSGESSGAFTRPSDLGRYFALAMHLAMRAAIPVAVGILLFGVIISLLQVGFLFTLKPLQPSLSKLNPIKGLQKMFSLRGVMRLLMSILKIAVVLGVAAICIKLDMAKILSLPGLKAGALLAASAALIWSLAIKIAIVLLILGLLDYAYQKWQHEQEMKMTKHEVKEEHKMMEGDPLTRQRRAKVARQLILQRLGADVPRADVVVTNPTHFAVALRYDSEKMDAPKVIAKGADFLAMRIRQIAAIHGIPIVERPPLARALYQTVEVGQQIPAQFFAAVAEILAYVYRLKGRKTA